MALGALGAAYNILSAETPGDMAIAGSMEATLLAISLVNPVAAGVVGFGIGMVLAPPAKDPTTEIDRGASGRGPGGPLPENQMTHDPKLTIDYTGG